MKRWHRAYWSWSAVLLAFFVAANAIWSVHLKTPAVGFPLPYLTRRGGGEAEFHWPALVVNVVVGLGAAIVVPWVLATIRTAPPVHADRGSAEPRATPDRAPRTEA